MRLNRIFFRACIAATLLFGAQGGAGADDYHAGPEDYRGFIPRLKAGDRLLLRSGVYEHGLPLHELNGLEGKPILIEGTLSGQKSRFVARPGANTVSLVNVQHLVIRNLELDGRNLPVDAVKAEGHASYAHHITLENLHITGHGNNQQTVGISTKCPARGWVIRDNIIEGAGTGIYLGNSDGSAPFWDGLLENNRVLDSLGYNLQIKHQKARPAGGSDGMESASTTIRNNFFRKAANSSTGAMARPNVLLGHWPLQGAGSDDRYLVHDNVFFNNSTEVLFQAEGRLALYNNVFVNPTGDAINIQPHNDIPRDMEIFYNTVLASGTGIVVREAGHEDAGFIQRVTGNVIAAETPLLAKGARYNLQLAYQPDLANQDGISKLNANLIKRGRGRIRLPDRLIRHYKIYPNWDHNRAAKRQNPSVPGAAISVETSDWILHAGETAPAPR
jgi:hypothetical protein